MAYITDDDYLTVISEANLREVTGDNPISRFDAEAIAEEEAGSTREERLAPA